MLARLRSLLFGVGLLTLALPACASSPDSCAAHEYDPEHPFDECVIDSSTYYYLIFTDEPYAHDFNLTAEEIGLFRACRESAGPVYEFSTLAWAFAVEDEGIEVPDSVLAACRTALADEGFFVSGYSPLGVG